MSATFYITPTKPEILDFASDMDTNLDEFVRELKSEFPGINIYPEQISEMVIHWELNWPSCNNFSDCMWGEMSNNRLWVYVDAHSKRETVAKFAKWYRHFVPKTYQLYFAPSWSMESFELLTTMNEDAIMRSIHELES